jgi:hypothetical protein
MSNYEVGRGTLVKANVEAIIITKSSWERPHRKTYSKVLQFGTIWKSLSNFFQGRNNSDIYFFAKVYFSE